MTARDLLAALRRRWYVLLAVLVMAAAVALVLPRQPGVWYSRVDVVFLVPNNPKLSGNALEGENASLINFTAAIERQVNGSSPQIELSSTDATLYGAGVERGFIVTLPNEGGQWSPSFDQSILRVEVVDQSEQATQTVATKVVDQIRSEAARTQDLLDIPAYQRIRTQSNPAAPTVSYVAGSAKRGYAVLVLLGLGVGVAASVQVDRALARRRVRTGRTVVASVGI